MEDVKFNYLTWGPFCMGVKVGPQITNRLIEDGKKQLESHNHELAGHLKYQFLYNDDTTKWFYTQTKTLWEMYLKYKAKYHGKEHDEREKLGWKNLWVNFMKPGDYNPEHVHGGDVSFVLFLDVPEALKKEQDEFEGTSPPPGSLVFTYGQKINEDWNTTSHSIQPKTGDLWVFPALQHHSVMPFKTDCTRISVSGNLMSNKIYNTRGLSPTYDNI